MKDHNMLPFQPQGATHAISVATAALQVTHTVLQKLCLRSLPQALTVCTCSHQRPSAAAALPMLCAAWGVMTV